MKKWIGLVALALFISTVYLANWIVNRYGIVSVGFGLMAPAAVYAAGLAFGLRDIVQRTIGRHWVLAGILAGAALSYTVSARFATASAVAFLVSETADFLIYTPLARRTLVGAVVASNTVGAVVDSLLFLWIAFGSLAFFWGQVVGKEWMTLPVLAVILALRFAGVRAFQPQAEPA